MLTADEVNRLDDFRFQRRMPSRAAAVRELLKRGLLAEGFLNRTNGGGLSYPGVHRKAGRRTR
jgi:hypothetical protein